MKYLLRYTVWGLGILDLALLVTVILLTMTEHVALFLNAVFMFLTLGAFRWSVAGFVTRSVVWVPIASFGMLEAVIDGRIQVEGLEEIPIMIGILVGVFMISKRRAEAQGQLQERDRAFLEAVLESMKDGVIAFNEEGEIVFSNRAFYGFYGSSEPLPPVERWTEYRKLYEADGETPIDESERPILRALRGESVEDQEVWVRGEGVPDLLLVVNTRQMVDSKGRRFGAVVVLRDATEERRTEDAQNELLKAERRKIARDLHDDVLQDLIDALYSMQLSRMKLNDRGEHVGELEKEIEILRNAIGGLRGAVYNLRRGGVQEQPFMRLLTSVVELNRQKAPGLQITLDVEEGFPAGLSGCEGLELVRILQEALVNARRHSGAGRVEITLGVCDGPAGEEIWAKVADDGRGLDPDTSWGGVGLSAMRERVGALGGRLEVESEPAEGTSVAVRVPNEALTETRASAEKG